MLKGAVRETERERVHKTPMSVRSGTQAKWIEVESIERESEEVEQKPMLVVKQIESVDL